MTHHLFIKITSLFFAFAMVSFNAFGGKLQVDEDSDIIWKSAESVEIEWSSNGTFNRVYSQKCQPVIIADRPGIIKAMNIAEEKAKVAIVYFINTELYGQRLVEEINSDIEATTSTQSTAKSDIIKNSKRNIISNFKEVIRSSTAASALKGIVVLEQGYSKERQEACVRVGITRKSTDAAKALSIELGGSKSSASGTQQTDIDTEVKKLRVPDQN